jgi:hypothetical protein
MQLAIPTFSRSIGGESADPIRRPIADIVSEGFDMAEPAA